MSEFLRLADGVRVLRRGPGQWQVGLGPERVVALTGEESAVRAVRRRLETGAGVETLDPDLVDRLRRSDLLDPHPTVSTGACVQVVRFGHAVAPDPVPLLHSAGHGVTTDPSSADVGLLIGVGEPSRDLVDPWVRSGTSHLVVRLGAGPRGTPVVGPLVEPGRSACLRCLDAHLTDLDPRWPQLVHQQAEQDDRPRRDGRAERPDPVVASLALAWAVHDLGSHVEGHRPPTWSATVTLPRHLAGLERREWRPHPECACVW